MAEPSKLENAQQPGDPALPNNPGTPREDLVSASAIAPPPPQPVDFKELWSASDALARAKALRNFFQLERDKIHAYWEISKRELEDIKSEIRNKEKEKEEIKERHQVERKVFKQKIRHVLYEQNAQIVQLKTEAERSLKVRMEEQRDAENDLQLDVRQLKQSKNELELQLRDEIMRTKQLHARELTEQRRAQEQALREMQIKYEKRIKSLREEMESQRKLEIDSIERRKAEHIKELRTTHDKAFADMKDYFNNITSSNLDTINTLKDEVTARKKTEMTNEKMMFEIAQQNKRLTEPLTKALNEQSTLKEELTNYERDKASLAEMKKELDKLEKAHKTLEWEHEVLRQRSERLVTERDEIRNRYQDVLSELEQKAIFKQIVLHKKVEVVQAQIERKEAQVSELLKETTSNDESSNSTRAVSEKVNQLVSSKNTLLEDLQNLLVNVTQRHEVIITAYETYFAQNGISGLSSHPRDKPNS